MEQDGMLNVIKIFIVAAFLGSLVLWISVILMLLWKFLG